MKSNISNYIEIYSQNFKEERACKIEYFASGITKCEVKNALHLMFNCLRFYHVLLINWMF